MKYLLQIRAADRRRCTNELASEIFLDQEPGDIMAKKKLVQELLSVLANTYAIYLKTHNYHWNVRGMNFQSLHLMFEDQYNELFAAMDEIAERVRALGETVPNHESLLKNFCKLESAVPEKNDRDMVLDLAHDHEHVIKLLYQASHLASEVDDEVTEGLMIDRLTVHEKTVWMLKATAA